MSAPVIMGKQGRSAALSRAGALGFCLGFLEEALLCIPPGGISDQLAPRGSTFPEARERSGAGLSD